MMIFARAIACITLLAACKTVPPPAPEVPDGMKAWDEAIADTTREDGLLPVRLGRDHQLLLELAPADLDRDLGLAITLSRGPGVLGANDGATFGTSRLVRLRRVGDHIALVQRSTRQQAAADGPLALAAARNDGEAVIGLLPIVSLGDGGVVLADATEVVTSDYGHIARQFQPTYGTPPETALVLDGKRSFVSRARGFARNLEIDATLTFAAAAPPAVPPPLADPFTVGVDERWSFFALPDQPMTARPSDERAGFFVDTTHDVDRLQITAIDFDVDHLRRWRLDPQAPGAGPSKPVTPIRYVLDPSIPAAYRPFVKEGVLAWNRAFAAAGFTDAIEVVDQPPADYDVDDLRFTTIRWQAAAWSTFGGLAMEHTDPRTGEIIAADILLDADFLVWTGTTLRGGNAGACAESSVIGAALAFVPIAQAAGVTGLDPQALVGDAIRSLVVHEVGHTLGLRHDFHGSSEIRRSDVGAPQLSASVMDYLPINVGGPAFQTEVGTTDVAQIRFGYAPLDDRTTVASLAGELATAGIEVADDSDADTGVWALDPATAQYDLGDDPVAFAHDRVTLIDQALPRVGETMVAPGDDYGVLRQRVPWILTWRTMMLENLVKVIGGATVHRLHRGDPGTPLMPIAGAIQRRALAELVTDAFAPGAYPVPPSLLALMAPRHAHRPAADSQEIMGVVPLDLPVHAIVLDHQRALLGELLAPVRLGRIVDHQLMAGKDGFRLAELFTGLTAGLTGELDAAAPAIDSFRRGVQTAYVDALIAIVGAPRGAALARGSLDWDAAGVDPPAPPADARALARRELTAIGKRARKAIAHAADEETAAHLDALAARIDAALAMSLTTSP